jgi:hypothetical protein
MPPKKAVTQTPPPSNSSTKRKARTPSPTPSTETAEQKKARLEAEAGEVDTEESATERRTRLAAEKKARLAAEKTARDKLLLDKIIAETAAAEKAAAEKAAAETAAAEKAAAAKAATEKTAAEKAAAAGSAVNTAASMANSAGSALHPASKQIPAFDLSSDEEDSVKELLVTNNVAAFVFALAGSVLIPVDLDPEGNELALLAVLNANRSSGTPFLATLPDPAEIFRLLGAPIACTGKDRLTRLLPMEVPMGTRRLEFTHNGRDSRIGKLLSADRDPRWNICTKRDVETLSYVHMAMLGFRRFAPTWSAPTHLYDRDRNIGASMHKSSTNYRGQDATPCDLYVQGPSNADSCLTCGLSTLRHIHHGQGTDSNQVADQLQLLSQALADSKKRPTSEQASNNPQLSPMTPSQQSTTFTTHTVLNQQAHKLLSWSKYGYDDWVTVRTAAKLACATGTRDHQKHHMSEDMVRVLSAYCDKREGTLADRSKKGLGLKALNEKPLDEWISAVDSMMREIFKVPEYDKLELTLQKDDKGRPSLESWRASWILFEGQENYHKEEERLKLLRDSIEENFKWLADDTLQSEYKRWRKDEVPLLDALFAVCDIFLPFTGSTVTLGGTGGTRPKGWKKFYCRNCGGNDSHFTKDCTLKSPTKSPRKDRRKGNEDAPPSFTCLTCRTSDHTEANCPKKTEVCKRCNKPGHKIEACYFDEKGKRDNAKVPKSYECKKCHKPGHWVENCPSAGKK